MEHEKSRPENINEYIAGFPKEVRKILKQLRATVRKAAPKAEEDISYGMPYYRLHGRLLYFAAHKNHIGFYPMATGISEFKTKISAYKWARGSVQFPFDKPLPTGLITNIIKFRVKENLERAAMKTKKNKTN